MSSADSKQKIRVEVVFAIPQKQELLALDVAAGSTVADAIHQSGIVELFEEVDMDITRVGIFGQKATPDQVLQNGDRVEIYRPLVIDPKEIRRQRAIKQAKQ
jgi:putative ubiquitin-RnfH superfamily antitoxin RatB of RatAB toxin-antitoxin module